MNSLRQVNENLTNTHVVVYDSQITVKLMGYLAIEASKMAHAGKNVDEIITRLNAVRATIDEIFVVDDLQNLVRGGRLSNASGFVGSLLKIKPLLTFDDQSHEIVAFEKVRSRKKKRCCGLKIFLPKLWLTRIIRSGGSLSMVTILKAAITG